MNVNLRFGSTPKAISPGVEKAAEAVFQSLNSFGKAQTPRQIKKSGARLVIKWMGLGVQLMAQGLGKRISHCFKG